MSRDVFILRFDGQPSINVTGPYSIQGISDFRTSQVVDDMPDAGPSKDDEVSSSIGEP
jgi:hypothetical protein